MSKRLLHTCLALLRLPVCCVQGPPRGWNPLLSCDLLESKFLEAKNVFCSCRIHDKYIFLRQLHKTFELTLNIFHVLAHMHALQNHTWYINSCYKPKKKHIHGRTKQNLNKSPQTKSTEKQMKDS
eukprot:GHVQ01035801.1.p1 GENE.GHVQ01035801.1~~GHVQ01035801.1.p1  ORF type:complete len:125 (+),score=7.42 GHVQ01035801.1:103-477(+)